MTVDVPTSLFARDAAEAHILPLSCFLLVAHIRLAPPARAASAPAAGGCCRRFPSCHLCEVRVSQDAFAALRGGAVLWVCSTAFNTKTPVIAAVSYIIIRTKVLYNTYYNLVQRQRAELISHLHLDPSLTCMSNFILIG